MNLEWNTNDCHDPHEKIIISTGVLTREPNTVSAVINIVNLNSNTPRNVVIEVWNWSSYNSPVKLPVLIDNNTPVIFPYKLRPHHLAVMYTDLNAANVNLYEIRIIHLKDQKIIANCFGRSAPPYTSQEGNTVFQEELTRIHLK